MKYMHCMVLLVAGFILISSVSTSVIAASGSSEPKFEIPPALEGIWTEILHLLFGLFIGPMNPISFEADPSTIEIDYLGDAETTLTFGDPTDEEFKLPVFLNEMVLFFEVEYPPGTPQEAWRAIFDPPFINAKTLVENGTFPQTKLHLSLTVPPDPNNPVNDMVLKVKLNITRKYGNLVVGQNWPWWIAVTMGFWKFSGSGEEVDVDCNIFVKIKQYHYAEMDIQSAPIEMGYNEMESIPIQVRNRGNHRDSFSFQVTGGDDKLEVNTPYPITLDPGEIGYTTLGLTTLDILYDRGTVHSIKIETYSIFQPDEILDERTFTVTTKGTYISEMNLIYLISLGILILLGIMFFLFRRKRRGIKPVEKIPEKRKILVKIQHTTKKLKQMLVNQKGKIQKSSVQLERKSYKTEKEIQRTNDLQRALIKARREQEKQKERIRAV